MTERVLPVAERVLPAIALPVPRGRTPNPDVVARPVARPVGAHRGQPWFTTPARAGMLIGASAAIYAVSLAGVSALQASSDAALNAQRQPYISTVAEAKAANDRLEAALRQVDRDTRSLVAAYSTAGDELAAYQGRLDALAALVADVQGSAASLPTHLSLPKVSVHTTSVGSAPRTTTKTSASGR
jgi:hypothetical protein